MTKQTGPKTARGKARSRYNAAKHGLYSEPPVLPGVESEDDWREHRRRLFADLAPEGYLQEILAEQIAVNTWRRKRLIRWERELVRNLQWDISREVALHANMRNREPSPDNPDHLARAQRFLMDRLMPEEKQLNLLIHYEGRLHRQLFQLLHELRSLKAQSTPPSAPDQQSPVNGRRPVDHSAPATTVDCDPTVAEASTPPPPGTTAGRGPTAPNALSPPSLGSRHSALKNRGKRRSRGPPRLRL